MQKKRQTTRLPVRRIARDEADSRRRDTLVVEEPLTVLWQAADGPSQKLAATMRTPGQDNDLAAGLLFSEGLLRHQKEVDVLSFCVSGAPNELNRLRAKLRLSHQEAESRLAHRPSAGMPQSACGLCSFDELSSPKALLKWAASTRPVGVRSPLPSREVLLKALDILQTQAPLFGQTGASHGVVLVGPHGNLLAAAEDVGRHNACDKAIGGLLLADRARPPVHFTLPPDTGMLFSSRLSFELAAKAVRAGAAWIASVGAPTHLAVELAQICRLPTVGFLSRERYNVYVEGQL